MRTLLLIIIIHLFALNLLSQEIENNNLISIHPIGLVNKVRLDYERAIIPKITYGGTGNFYYDSDFHENYMGIKLEPFIRFYTGKRSYKGLYLQLKVGAGVFQKHETIYNYHTIFNDENQFLDEIYSSRKELNRFPTYGGGAAIGVKFSLGKKSHTYVDLHIGIQTYYYKSYSKHESYIDADGNTHDISESYSSRYKCMNFGAWEFLGPGGVFNPQFAIGYRF